MNPRSAAALTAAVVFAIAMGALQDGGWWWAWLSASAAVTLARGVRLPLIGVKLSPTNAYVLRENRKTRRHNHELARRRRRIQRQQRRAQRARRRQAQ
jgi:hypothetical protein